MSGEDPYNLARFLSAQEDNYTEALAEIRSGRKRSHWMWYIFPQIDGLGWSTTSKFFAIKNADEARAYLNHPILGHRLLECAQAVLDVKERSATEMFGSPDDLKLRSCATLFALVSSPGNMFEQIIEKYFAGRRDEKTIELLNKA